MEQRINEKLFIYTPYKISFGTCRHNAVHSVTFDSMSIRNIQNNICIRFMYFTFLKSSMTTYINDLHNIAA